MVDTAASTDDDEDDDDDDDDDDDSDDIEADAGGRRPPEKRRRSEPQPVKNLRQNGTTKSRELRSSGRLKPHSSESNLSCQSDSAAAVTGM